MRDYSWHIEKWSKKLCIRDKKYENMLYEKMVKRISKKDKWGVKLEFEIYRPSCCSLGKNIKLII